MSAKIKYFQGDYEGASSQNNQIETMPYKIGGLVFIGKHQEARLLYKAHSKVLQTDGLVISNFHLGISYTRTSEYEKSREFFFKNLRLARGGTISHEAKFFAFQGASFYRFFFSRHKKSQFFAEKGYHHLLQMDSAPSLLLGLSLDIQAHNKTQLGFYNQGAKLFEEALRVTKADGLSDLYSEIEISHLFYQSAFDTDLDKHSKALMAHLERSQNKNDFSKSEIVLQIAKLYLLMGKFSQASVFLNANFDVIYKNENKRKIATLNTLIAQLIIFKGQFLEALSIVNVALSHLNPAVDKSLYLPLLGIKIKALSHLGKDASGEIAESRRIIGDIDRAINRNIQDRYRGVMKSRGVGDDKIADLLDSVKKKTPQIIKEILAKGFLSAIFELYDLVPGRNYIVVLEAMDTVVIADEDGIFDTQKSLTRLQVSILNLLQLGPQSKEALIEKIWGYKYDPLRHDPLIYTSMARLRKILNPNGSWILADENLYSLNPKVTIVCPDASAKMKFDSAEMPKNKIDFSTLNYRQIEFLASGSQHPLSVSEYGKAWDVTRMTALRDLKGLVDGKRVQQIGRGRATRYLLII